LQLVVEFEQIHFSHLAHGDARTHEGRRLN
jgi:hypothetical protein